VEARSAPPYLHVPRSTLEVCHCTRTIHKGPVTLLLNVYIFHIHASCNFFYSTS